MHVASSFGKPPMFLERQVGLPEPSLFHTELQRELLRWDTDDAAAEEQMLAGKMSSKRAADQRKVYDEIIAELLRWRSAPRTTKVHEAAPQYFVDAAQGRGKTTLAQRLIARLRAEPDAVVLVVASTGLAALNYKGATTAHALFRIPVKDPDDDSDVLQCAIGRSSQRAEIIRAASVIIWDELAMADVSWMDAVDQALSDILQDSRPSGPAAAFSAFH